MAANHEFDTNRTGAPLVVVGRRFLPVSAQWASFAPGVSEPQTIPTPAATIVHAVSAGRVIRDIHGVAGEVVLRGPDEISAHYWRLRPSSVKVKAGDRVEAGQVLGVVAQSKSEPGFSFGMQNNNGEWLDVSEQLCGATDPDELLISPSGFLKSSSEISAEATPKPRRRAAAPTDGGSPTKNSVKIIQPESGTDAPKATDAPEPADQVAPKGDDQPAIEPESEPSVSKRTETSDDVRVASLAARRRRK